jgi:4-carboxymuconolactone decarboxylase
MSKDQPTPDETMRKIGDFAPKLMELTDDVLFGDIWERPGLSKRDRSLITVAALVALYRINELPFHIVRAQENGISKDELAEIFTHLAFYAGWPSAMTAARTAVQVLAETE